MSENQISSKIAKDVLEIEWKESTGAPRAKIVEARGMKQVTDESAIERAVDEVIAANPEKAADARAKPKVASWFVGQVMKATGGKANPQSVTAILKRRLGLPDDG
jgi:aspartyl-tRNA(Asn)/glutamyl-tRNA(Gln) amidotransferase subunit B